MQLYHLRYFSSWSRQPIITVQPKEQQKYNPNKEMSINKCSWRCSMFIELFIRKPIETIIEKKYFLPPYEHLCKRLQIFANVYLIQLRTDSILFSTHSVHGKIDWLWRWKNGESCLHVPVANVLYDKDRVTSLMVTTATATKYKLVCIKMHELSINGNIGRRSTFLNSLRSH